jgi:hypothetical protein
LDSWVSASLQPDNLVALLVVVAISAMLSLKASPRDRRALYGLDLTLVLLSFVKPHYAAVIYVVAAGLLLSRFNAIGRSAFERTRAIAPALLLPPLAAVITSLVTPVGLLSGATPLPATVAAHASFLDAVASLEHWAGLGMWTTYAGHAFEGFWINFATDETPSVAAAAVREPIEQILFMLTVVVSSTIVLCQCRVFARAIVIGRRRSAFQAIRLIAGDIVLNSYVIWTIFLLIVYVHFGGAFRLQGRYWLAVLPCIVALGVFYVPRAFPRRVRAVARTVSLGAWLCFSLSASIIALEAMSFRYHRTAIHDATGPLIYVTSMSDSRGNSLHNLAVRVQRNSTLSVTGWAMSKSASGLKAIHLVSESGKRFGVRYGLPSPRIADWFADTTLLHSAFIASVKVAALPLGHNDLEFYGCTDAHRCLGSATHLDLEVTP